MDLFIETPQRIAERSNMPQAAQPAVNIEDALYASTGDVSACGGRGHGGPAVSRYVVEELDLDEPDSKRSSNGEYRKELVYEARRSRSKVIWSVVRAVLFALSVPLILVAVFFIAYVGTLIARGATSEQVAEALGDLVSGIFGYIEASRHV